ncbi:MAG: glycosyltransferase family 4 protein, partial [Clostridia bacterium]
MNIIMFSDNKVWSLGKGSGAPSFYNTLKLYNDKGDKVFLVQPQNVADNFAELENVNIISFKESVFFKFNNIKKIGYFAKIICHIKNTKNYKREAKKIVYKHKIDLLYAYEIDGVAAAKKLEKKLKLPIVTRYQGTILSNIKLNILNRIRYVLHVRAIQTKSNLCIMTNDGTNGDIVLQKLKNDSPTLFLRNGVNKCNIDENLIKELNIKFKSNNETILMTLSRVENWKKIDRAIKIVKNLIDKSFNVKLLIIGEGSDVDRLQTLSSNYGISNRVIFCGKIERDKVYSYLSIADIFLSLYDLSNVGNPLLEAMKAGKCIVTLNVGTTNQIVINNENGLIFDIDKITDIPDAIANILNNKVEISRLSANALDYAN